METITTEEVARHYNSAMDSVNLIVALKAKESLTEQEKDTLSRNVEHIKIMLTKDYWTTEDLTPFKNAIK